MHCSVCGRRTHDTTTHTQTYEICGHWKDCVAQASVYIYNLGFHAERKLQTVYTHAYVMVAFGRRTEGWWPVCYLPARQSARILCQNMAGRQRMHGHGRHWCVRTVCVWLNSQQCCSVVQMCACCLLHLIGLYWMAGMAGCVAVVLVVDGGATEVEAGFVAGSVVVCALAHTYSCMPWAIYVFSSEWNKV